MIYSEKSWGKSRSFIVEGDTLHLTAKKAFGGVSNISIDLKKIKPEPDVHFVKDDTRTGMVGLPGLIIFMIGAFGGTVIYEKSPSAFYSILGIGLTAMIAGFIFGGKMKIYLFKSHEEIGIFEVSGRGNSPEAFESFVEELKQRVRAPHSTR